MMDILLAHMEDIAQKAVKTGVAASKFLTPAEAQAVAERFAHNRAELSFDGGAASAERVRAVFLNPDWGSYNRAELLTALKIECREPLTHRDILGALMALGLERNTIGDIIDHAAMFVCLPELSGYIAENLTKIGRAGVTVSEISLDMLPEKSEDLAIKTDTVASLRLDAVLSAAFGTSRAKAAELIASGRVNLNHQPCVQPAKELSEGALLSVRGHGRAKLLEVGGTSKKGRIFLQIGLYGK